MKIALNQISLEQLSSKGLCLWKNVQPTFFGINVVLKNFPQKQFTSNDFYLSKNCSGQIFLVKLYSERLFLNKGCSKLIFLGSNSLQINLPWKKKLLRPTLVGEKLLRINFPWKCFTPNEFFLDKTTPNNFL